VLAAILLASAWNPVDSIGKGLETEKRRYAAEKRFDSVVVGHSRRESWEGRLGSNRLRLTAHDGRVSEIEVDFAARRALSPTEALTAAGIPSAGVKVVANPVRKYAEVEIRDWVLSGGALGKGEGILTRNVASDGSIEQLLNIAAPSSFFFAPSTTDRKAILAGLRGPVEKAFRGQKVEFIVSKITVARGWAFVYGQPRKQGGGFLDLAKSDFAEANREGLYDDNVSGLLRFTNDKWLAREVVIGATDVPWVDWPEKYSIPKLLFFDSLE